jgi:hypothetical protein
MADGKQAVTESVSKRKSLSLLLVDIPVLKQAKAEYARLQ